MERKSRGFKDLNVYNLAFETAMEIFHLSKDFPVEEKYSLTDQIHRSSRSVCANIAEGYRKRIYPKHFTSKMTDADAEASETCVWLDFAKECNYIDENKNKLLLSKYDEVGRMLWSMINNPEKFLPK